MPSYSLHFSFSCPTKILCVTNHILPVFINLKNTLDVLQVSVPLFTGVPCFSVDSPEELVEVSVFHIFKHHDERVALDTHPVEGDDVLVLQVGQKLRLSVEVRPAALVGFFQCLKKKGKRQRLD